MLPAYTAGAAYAEFQENRKGTLEAGKDADFAVLSRNPLHVRSQELAVEMTISRGEIVFAEKPVSSLG